MGVIILLFFTGAGVLFLLYALVNFWRESRRPQLHAQVRANAGRRPQPKTVAAHPHAANVMPFAVLPTARKSAKLGQTKRLGERSSFLGHGR